MASDKVQVAVRVRPMNRRELDLGTKCVVDMQENQIILFHPKDIPHDEGGGSGGKDRSGGGGRKAPKTFAFDHCFWTIDKNDPRFAGQDKVFNCLGSAILERSFEGYNGCIFAYGQTGSGKSYTMMGTMEEKGIIPRLCDSLFERIAVNQDEDNSYKVEVSYMEIYNEKVHDLLDLKGSKHNLKVREHNILGPYVDGLSTLVVSSFEDIDNLMSEGNKSRTVAATNMNSESSRSHAVFNIIVTQTLTDRESMVSGEKVSKLSLVDLAGSERAQKTGAVGDRLREGSNINKSLTTLGLVISALAEQSGGRKKDKFVPYRDSVLTWLLKDNLGGNSKTVMIATISPAADNFEETLSTLRYADRAKRIVNHAVVNEDPNARIIRELRNEVDMLRKELQEAQSMKAPDLKDRLEESEKLIKEMTKTWEEKLMETERIHQDRHQALERMGISVQTSGIKVEQGKYFLVNLNADPSLNELLVYYLKEHTLVGCPGGPDADHIEHDIQLSGLGIQPQHCLVEIVNNEVFLTPFEGARTCVNGSVIHERTRVKHGNRILWGNNHFFRLNCPKKNSPHTMEPEQKIDFDFAQQELMMNEYSNDPISEAIMAMEKQYEEDKQEALEKQRQMYEQQMQMLRNQLMSPGTPSGPFPALDINRLTPTSSQSGIQKKYQQWAQERDKLFKQSLAKLREEVVKANSLVREANFLAQEMGKKTEFHVTLQIPASNLSPNRRRGAFVSEPAILVRRKGRGSQIWSMDKFENKIIDMRDMYEERKNQGLPMRVEENDDDSDSDDGPLQRGDPFYESQENHNLIGVANVFLECLFYDVKLDYHVPIISQQGEVAGKLHVEISKLGGDMLDRFADIHVEDSDEEGSTAAGTPVGSPMIVRVCIHGAKGLPRELSHFVFCQYSFWGQEEPITVAPVINPEASSINPKKGTMSFRFDHKRDFKINVIDEFVEHCYDRALSIEVWGHRIVGFGSQVSYVESKTMSLTDRWSEVMRKIELRVEIQELNDQGEYAPVEVKPQPDVPCAGVFQLRQGHSRRIQVRVKPVAHSGTLPLICEAITSISVGSICGRFKLQKGLDSYQEEDLNLVRDRWSEALARRKNYLDEQIQKLINKTDKSESDSDRERALIEQWVCLTEERNAVMVPAAGSGIPGAPADWDAPPDMERHMPVLFLDLNADDMSTPNAKEGLQAAGINSILVREQPSSFLSLPIIKTYTEKENVCAVVSWDSSVHDSNYLNRLTSSNERVYMILKAIVRLSHPASMELVLRKRLCINIYMKHTISSFTDKLKQRFIGTDVFKASGITYDVVSNIPKASEDLENMETLAQMAASSNEVNAADGETYIEKYIKGVSAVESILTLDRLRQEVAVKELMAIQGRNLTKTTSVPNINQHFMSPPRLDQKMRFDSIQDLSATDRSFSPGESSFRKRAYSAIGLDIVTIAKELTYKCSATLARPTFLDLRVNSGSNSAKLGGKLSMSPLGAKMIPMKPLRTLQEEQQRRESKPLLHHDTEEEDEDSPVRPNPPIKTNIESDPHSVCSDDFQDFESYQSQQSQKQEADKDDTSIPHSGTNESLAEIPTKNYTPSMASSGYGSQAVSTLTLSSEDSLSLRSNEDNIESGKDKMARRSQMLGQTSSGESDLGEDESHAAQKEDESHAAQKEDESHATQKEEESHTGQKVDESDVAQKVDESQAAQKEKETSFIVEATEAKNVLSQTSKVAMENKIKSFKENKTEAKSNASQTKKESEEHKISPIMTVMTAEAKSNASQTKKESEEHKMSPVITVMTDEVKSNASQTKIESEEHKISPIITVTNAEVKSNASQTKKVEIKKYSHPEQSLFDDDIEEEELEMTDKFLDLHISEEDLRIDPSNKEMGEDLVHISSAMDGSKHRTKVSDNSNIHKGSDNSDIHKGSDNSNIHKGSDNSKNPSKDDVISEKQRESKLDSVHEKSLQKVFSDKSAKQSNQNKDNISVRTGRDDSLSKTNTSVVSDSSSGYSRSLHHSESFDPYSEEAMEELERLGEDEGPDNSEFLSMDDRNDSTTGMTLLERSLTRSESIEDRLHIRPENQSTPKSVAGLGSSEKRPRPVSCLVFSPGNEEFSEGLLEEKKKRNSFIGNSDEHLSEDSASICSFGSRADLDRLQESPVPSWIQVGESVQVIPSRGGTKMTGVVQYVGTVEFASGPWVGVELDLPEGKNDGSVKGIQYFKCRSRHGIFVRHDKLIWDKRRRNSRKNAANFMSRRSTGQTSSHVTSPLSSSQKATASSNAKKK